MRRPLARLFRYVHPFRLRWSLRILGWLVGEGLISRAGWQYAVLGPVAFESLVLIWMLAETRRVRRFASPVSVDEHSPLAEKLRAEARRQAALPRVASPGGWSVPDGVRPAWNWTPPPGIEARLDRVPRWARVWNATPFVDRYAHAWLWHHGGWDVVPPEAWTENLS